MKPDENPEPTRRLSYNATLPGRGLLGSALAIVAGVTALVLGFTFLLLILAAVAVIGVLGYGYLWWKTRALRRHIREQMDYEAQHGPVTPSPDGNAVEGEIIEGVIIREDRETPK